MPFFFPKKKKVLGFPIHTIVTDKVQHITVPTPQGKHNITVHLHCATGIIAQVTKALCPMPYCDNSLVRHSYIQYHPMLIIHACQKRGRWTFSKTYSIIFCCYEKFPEPKHRRGQENLSDDICFFEGIYFFCYDTIKNMFSI